MKQIISEFNDTLKRNNSLAIICIEDRTEWVIETKKNAADFIKALEAVVNDVYDYAECKILNAELFDSGYSMEVKASIFNEDKETTIEFYLYNANKF